LQNVILPKKTLLFPHFSLVQKKIVTLNVQYLHIFHKSVRVPH
jgi:hypothetical protein